MTPSHLPHPLIAFDESAVRTFLHRPLSADDPAAGSWADSIDGDNPRQAWRGFVEDLRDLRNALVAQGIGLRFSPHIDPVRHFDLDPFGDGENDADEGADLLVFLANGLTLHCDTVYPWSLAGDDTGAEAAISALRTITDSVNIAFTQVLEIATVVFTDQAAPSVVTPNTNRSQVAGGRIGWAWGTTDGADWLTLLGSAWNTPALADTPAEADKHLDNIVGSDLVLAKVREVRQPGLPGKGMAYKILERADNDQK